MGMSAAIILFTIRPSRAIDKSIRVLRYTEVQNYGDVDAG